MDNNKKGLIFLGITAVIIYFVFNSPKSKKSSSKSSQSDSIRGSQYRNIYQLTSNIQMQVINPETGAVEIVNLNRGRIIKGDISPNDDTGLIYTTMSGNFPNFGNPNEMRFGISPSLLKKI